MSLETGNHGQRYPCLIVTDDDQSQRQVSSLSTKPKDGLFPASKSGGYQTDIIDRARSKFAVNAERGIEFLLKHRLIENNPREIANFLQHCGFLDKVQIGEYLTTPKNILVLEYYLRLIPMVDVSLEGALRRVLMRFKLPGEAQKIDRLLDAFAQHYHQCNPTAFLCKDLVYIVSFSMVLLNTDLHNPNNPRRMSKEAFIANNRAVEGGESIPQEMLSEIYDAIAKNELMTEAEGLFDYPLSGPDIEGVLWKKSDRFHSWNRRWCVAVNRCLYYFSSKHDSNPRGVIPLEDLAVRPLDRRGKFRFEITAEDGDGSFIDVNNRTEPHPGTYVTPTSSPSEFSQCSTVRSTSSWFGDGRSLIFFSSSTSASASASASASISSISTGRKLPLIKSAKYVKGQLVEGRRDRYIFQCASRDERDRWVAILKSLIVHRPSSFLPGFPLSQPDASSS